MEKENVRGYEANAVNDVDIGRMITNISYGIRQYYDRMYTAYNITYPQSRVLSRLLFMSDKGVVNQRDLEAALGIKASSVSSLVRNLELKGFVRCERQPQDTRNKSVILTEKGVELENTLSKTRAQMEVVLASGLDPEKLEEVREALGIIMTNLDATLTDNH